MGNGGVPRCLGVPLELSHLGEASFTELCRRKKRSPKSCLKGKLKDESRGISWVSQRVSCSPFFRSKCCAFSQKAVKDFRAVKSEICIVLVCPAVS